MRITQPIANVTIVATNNKNEDVKRKELNPNLVKMPNGCPIMATIPNGMDR